MCKILCKCPCLESFIIEKCNKERLGKPVLILLTEKNISIPSVSREKRTGPQWGISGILGSEHQVINFELNLTLTSSI